MTWNSNKLVSRVDRSGPMAVEICFSVFIKHDCWAIRVPLRQFRCLLDNTQTATTVPMSLFPRAYSALSWRSRGPLGVRSAQNEKSYTQTVGNYTGRRPPDYASDEQPGWSPAIHLIDILSFRVDREPKVRLSRLKTKRPAIERVDRYCKPSRICY
jgi:hypothetical protein